MYKNNYCLACNNMSDVLVQYLMDDGARNVLVCPECSERLEGSNGKE
jgi:hypothetical protein